MKTFFTSDNHFGHANVIKYANRPFNNVEEMNEVMIKNLNEKVGADDRLYFVGDFIFGNSKIANEILNRINCKNKFFVYGNHDKAMYDNTVAKHFIKMTPYLEVKVPLPSNPSVEQGIILFHYPILEWNKGHFGAWMLHGHCHGNLEYPDSLKDKKIADIGVDCWNYYPVSMEELENLFKDRNNITHHKD